MQGREKSKQRFTIAFLVSAAGAKEKPIVIWTCEKPRCFRGFDVSSLPVKYYHQKKAWMTGEILSDYMTGFNQKMQAEKDILSTLRIADTLVHRPLSFIRRVSLIQVLGLYHLQFML